MHLSPSASSRATRSLPLVAALLLAPAAAPAQQRTALIVVERAPGAAASDSAPIEERARAELETAGVHALSDAEAEARAKARETRLTEDADCAPALAHDLGADYALALRLNRSGDRLVLLLELSQVDPRRRLGVERALGGDAEKLAKGNALKNALGRLLAQLQQPARSSRCST